jgi:hypothetical protein
MTTAKWTSIQECNRIYTILLQDLMKRGVFAGVEWSGDALSKLQHNFCLM